MEQHGVKILKKSENWHRSCIPAKERLWKVQKI